MNARSVAIAAPGRARVWTSFTLAFLLMASLLSSLVTVRGLSAQTAGDSLASVVPADTVIYMAVDLNQESEQWMQAFELMERAGLSDLAEDELGASTEDLGEVAEAENISGRAAVVFTDADSLVHFSTGDLATAAESMDTMDMAMSDSPEVPEGFAMIVQPDDPAALSAQFVEMATNEADAEGAMLQTIDYNGVTVTYWESDDTNAMGTATAELDGTVILATRVSDIEPIIDTMQGTSDNLTSHDGFNSVYDKLETNALVFGYMNLDTMMTAVQADPAIADLLGGGGLSGDLESGKGYAGWSMYASENGFHMDTVMVPNDASSIPTGIDFTPSMAASIPADVMIFANANNLYGTGVTDMMGSLMQVALAESGTTSEGVSTPEATPTVEETWAFFEQVLGFNPDTDLMAKLDGEYAMYAGVYDLESGMPTPEFLFVSQTSDPATLTETTAVITQLMTEMNEGDYEMSSRTVEGGELTTMTMSDDATGGLPVVMEFGLVDGQMLIGMNGAVDKYLAGDAPSLADDANFQNTFSLLPSENVISVGYLNIEGQVMPLLDMMVGMMNSSMSTLDNHEDCAMYATQLEAQTAYDADPSNLWLLDMDYDGEACEDFFGETMAVSSPEPIANQVNMPAAGMVTWSDGEAVYTNSILVIGD